MITVIKLKVLDADLSWHLANECQKCVTNYNQFLRLMRSCAVLLPTWTRLRDDTAVWVTGLVEQNTVHSDPCPLMCKRAYAEHMSCDLDCKMELSRCSLRVVNPIYKVERLLIEVVRCYFSLCVTYWAGTVAAWHHETLYLSLALLSALFN